jgi:hypothetical protein
MGESPKHYADPKQGQTQTMHTICEVPEQTKLFLAERIQNEFTWNRGMLWGTD